MNRRKTWYSLEWRTERSKRIENQVCSQCGASMDLQIHHHYSDSKLHNIMKSRIIKALIREKMDSGDFLFQGLEITQISCPHCSIKLKITRSRFETSQYIKCTTCQKRITFKILNLADLTYFKEPNYHLKRTDLNIFMHKYQNEIVHRLNDKHAPLPFDYSNLAQDTVILCKTCHYALENGHDLYPTCHKNYKKINEKCCFECESEEKKAVIMQNQ